MFYSNGWVLSTMAGTVFDSMPATKFEGQH